MIRRSLTALGAAFALVVLAAVPLNQLSAAPAEAAAATVAGNAVPGTVDLDGSNWRIHGYDIGEGVAAGAQAAEFDDSTWIKATVPGTANGTLADVGITPNPLVVGSTGWQSVGSQEWWYRTTIDAPATWAGANVRLHIEGAMDEADVYVDGTKLGSTDGMYDNEYFTIPAASLTAGSHVIAIRTYPDSRGTYSRPSIYANVAGWAGFQNYNTVRTVGLWRPVSLVVTRPAGNIVSTFVHTDGTLTADSTSAKLDIKQSVQNNTGSSENLTLRWRLAGDDFKLTPLTGSVPVTAQPGLNVFGYAITVTGANLHLWWPNGYGANLPDGSRYLYKLTTDLYTSAQKLDSVTTGSIGIRSITYKPTAGASSSDYPLNYVVNSEPIYAQGADWVPADALYRSDVEQDAYEKDLRLAFEGGARFLRLWGGGVVEQPEFYALASKYGILLEQEFWNFGPTTYTVDPTLWANNADAIVKDVRNYPALAVWSGGNELAGYYMGDANLAESYPWVKDVQQSVSALDGSRQFLPTDPVGGECHYWGDLHLVGSQGYWNTGNAPCGMMSESGISSAPDPNILSEFEGSNTADAYRDLSQGTTGDWLSPNEFGTYLSNTDLANKSQLAQAIDDSYIAGQQKAQKWASSGALVWEYNDMAPMVGWSVVASNGQPKAAYYYLKRQWADVSVQIGLSSPSVAPGARFTPTIAAINDTTAALNGYQLVTTEETISGKQLGRQEADVNVSANASGGVAKVAYESFTAPSVPETFVLVSDVFNGKGQRVARDTALLSTEPNDSFYSLGAQSDPSSLKVTQPSGNSKNTATVTNTGKAVAYAVDIDVAGDGRPSDNFFTLLPGESESVAIENANGKSTNAHVTVTEADSDPTSANLALGRGAYGSQDDYKAGSGGNAAQRNALYATDGGADYTGAANYSTWSAKTKGAATLTVDLGKVKSIGEVVTQWGSGYGTDYTIQVSTDDKDWTSVATATAGTGGTDVESFNPVSARWVRLNGTASSGEYDVQELAVYASAASAPQQCANVPGAIEFENLTSFDVSSNGVRRTQLDNTPVLSGCGADVLTPQTPGSGSETYSVSAPGGYYEVYLGVQTRSDGGTIQASVNGTKAGSAIDTYSAATGTSRIDLGPQYIAARSTLGIAITGADTASTGSVAALDYVQLKPITISSGDFYEAESLTPTTVAGSAAVFADALASGGAGMKFTPTRVGASMSFTVNVATSGTYNLILGQKDQAARGIMQVSVDGTNVGDPIDQYRGPDTYLASDAGTVELAAGPHTVTFTVTGHNPAAAAGSTLGIDFLWFEPHAS